MLKNWDIFFKFLTGLKKKSLYHWLQLKKLQITVPQVQRSTALVVSSVSVDDIQKKFFDFDLLDSKVFISILSVTGYFFTKPLT